MRGVLDLVLGWVLLVLRRLLRRVWWLCRWGPCMLEYGMAGVAVLAIDGVASVARGAIGDKGITAVCAYPLSPQVLCAAFRAGNC